MKRKSEIIDDAIIRWTSTEGSRLDRFRSSSSTTIKFMLHCPHGAPPFLTPYLLQTYFSSAISSHFLAFGIDISDSSVVPVFSSSESKASETTTTTTTKMPLLSKRQQKKVQRRPKLQLLAAASDEAAVVVSKPLRYTFVGRPMDTYFHIPITYETILVPTWDDYSAVDSSSSSNNGMALTTTHGRITLDPTTYIQVVQGFQTATSCVLLYDNNTKNASSSKASAINPVERTCQYVDHTLAAFSSTSTNHTTTKFWIPVVGGQDVELRKQSIKEALLRCSANPHCVQGIALIGLLDATCSNTNNGTTTDNLLHHCLPDIPTHVPIAVLSNTNCLQILDCMRSGIDIIGSPLPLTLAKHQQALVFDIYGWKQPRNNNNNNENYDKAKRIRSLEKEEEDDLSIHEIIPSTISIMDISNDKYERDTSPLQMGCRCYTCQNHHMRAYIHHLVNSKELLGEILLFLHNLHHILEWFHEYSIAIQNGMEQDFIKYICKQLRSCPTTTQTNMFRENE